MSRPVLFALWYLLQDIVGGPFGFDGSEDGWGLLWMTDWLAGLVMHTSCADQADVVLYLIRAYLEIERCPVIQGHTE